MTATTTITSKQLLLISIVLSASFCLIMPSVHCWVVTEHHHHEHQQQQQNQQGQISYQYQTQSGGGDCIGPHQSHFDSCSGKFQDTAHWTLDYSTLQAVDPANLTAEAKAARQFLESACCSFLQYHDCVDTIASQHCDSSSDATVAVNELVGSIRGASIRCEEFRAAIFWDCPQRVKLVKIVLGVLLVSGIATLIGMICCCYRCYRG